MLNIGPRFSIIPKNAGPTPEKLPVGLPVQFGSEAAGTQRARRSENAENRILRGRHLRRLRPDAVCRVEFSLGGIQNVQRPTAGIVFHPESEILPASLVALPDLE